MRVGKFVNIAPVVLGACIAAPFEDEIVFEGHNTGVSNTVDFPIGATPLDPPSAPPVPEPTPVKPQARPSAEGQVLGTTVVSLGSPTDVGLWVGTPLVRAVVQGTAMVVETGKSVSVELRPIPGAPTAGSRASLEAMRALGLPLTALAELELKID